MSVLASITGRAAFGLLALLFPGLVMVVALRGGAARLRLGQMIRVSLGRKEELAAANAQEQSL